jgi:hypothetical protein
MPQQQGRTQPPQPMNIQITSKEILPLWRCWTGSPQRASLSPPQTIPISHNYPGVNGGFPIDNILAKPLQEQILVLVILEDG